MTDCVAGAQCTCTDSSYLQWKHTIRNSLHHVFPNTPNRLLPKQNKIYNLPSASAHGKNSTATAATVARSEVTKLSVQCTLLRYLCLCSTILRVGMHCVRYGQLQLQCCDWGCERKQTCRLECDGDRSFLELATSLTT